MCFFLKNTEHVSLRDYNSRGLHVDYEIYANACNNYEVLWQSTKQKYFNDAVLDCDGDHGKMFLVINQLLHRASSSPLPMVDSHTNYSIELHHHHFLWPILTTTTPSSFIITTSYGQFSKSTGK